MLSSNLVNHIFNSNFIELLENNYLFSLASQISISSSLLIALVLLSLSLGINLKPEIIHLAGKAVKEGLDILAKTVGRVAGSTIIYNNYGGSGSSNDKDKKIRKTIRKMTIIRIIRKIVRVIVNQINKNILPIKNNLYSYSFYLPLILSKLELNVDDSSTSITQIFYGVFLLSLVALLCLINIIGYMLAYILINEKDYENKYPKLSKIINYYKKGSLIYMSFEVILCLTSLLLLTTLSLMIIYSNS